MRERAGKYDHYNLARKIGRLGSNGRSAAPYLMRLVDEGEEEFIETLGLIGAAEAQEVLERALTTSTTNSRIRASIALSRLGIASGDNWFFKELPTLSFKYSKDKDAWEDALAHFWNKSTGPQRDAIRGVLSEVYGDDSAEWPSKFQPADDRARRKTD